MWYILAYVKFLLKKRTIFIYVNITYFTFTTCNRLAEPTQLQRETFEGNQDCVPSTLAENNLRKFFKYNRRIPLDLRNVFASKLNIAF